MSFGQGRPTLGEIVETEAISVDGKKFLVTATEKQGGGFDSMDRSNIPFPDGHHITAQELTDEFAIKPDGLRVQFYQTGFFLQECMVQCPSVIGRMEPTFAPFQPK